MKKLLAVLLTIILSVSFTYSIVYATNNRVKDEDSSIAEQKETTEEKKEEVEKKEEQSEKKEEEILPIGPDIKAEAAFLINPSTGVIIYEKNADKHMYPASTTKIMTAYLALKNLDLNANYTASATAVDIDRDGSNMGLSQGEILTGRQLIDSLVIHSANDAANVLAEAVSGSVSEFVNLMNATAIEIGMKNTHFANPHGYHDDNHYTTARDMATLASVAMKNEVFAEMVAARKIVIPPTNKYHTERIFNTRNSLINPYSDISTQYRFATGIKTGHTSAAGYCFVGSAVKNGLDLISVVLNSSSFNRSFIDTKNLFEHAYSNYRLRTVIKSDEIASTCNVKWAWGKDHLVLKTNKDVKTLLPRNTFSEELLKSEINIENNIKAPIKEGEVLGNVKFFYDGNLVAESDLYASRSVSKNIFKQIFSYLLSPWFLSFLGVVVIFILTLKIKDSHQKRTPSKNI